MISFDSFKEMIADVLVAIEARSNEFSELDAKTGDGDHGTAIVAALRAVSNTLQEGSDLKQSLFDAGFAAMTESSGSTSTLLGSLFLGLSDGVASQDTDVVQLKAMFTAGLASIRQQTKADVGDKTLMDALIPAVNALGAYGGDSPKEALTEAAKAAQKGAEATVEMQATFGRARNLKEKSIGFADAGATSMAAIFATLAESCK